MYNNVKPLTLSLERTQTGFKDFLSGKDSHSLNLQENLTVSGSSLLDGTLTVNADTTVGSNLTVSGNSLLEGTLTVNADTTVGSNLTVSGYTVFNSDVLINGNFTSLGTITSINSTNLVIEDKIITLNKGGNNSDGSGIEIEKDGSIVSYIQTSGNSFIFKTESGDEARLGSELFVSSNGTIGSNLTVSGNSLMEGTMTVGGVSVFNADTTLSSNLTVSGNSLMEGSLTVTGNSILGGGGSNTIGFFGASGTERTSLNGLATVISSNTTETTHLVNQIRDLLIAHGLAT